MQQNSFKARLGCIYEQHPVTWIKDDVDSCHQTVDIVAGHKITFHEEECFKFLFTVTECGNPNITYQEIPLL